MESLLELAVITVERHGEALGCACSWFFLPMCVQMTLAKQAVGDLSSTQSWPSKPYIRCNEL